MGIESILLDGPVQMAQARQKQEMRDKPKASLPSLGSVGSYASPLTYRIVSHISNSQRLSGAEKDGLIKTVSVVDEFAKTESLRNRMLNSIAAVAQFLEQTTPVEYTPSQTSVKQAQEYYAQVRAELAKAQTKPKNDAGLEVSVKQELNRMVQQFREESFDTAVAQGAKNLEAITGNRVSEVVDGLQKPQAEPEAAEIAQPALRLPGEGATEVAVAPLPLPGSGGAKTAEALALPGSRLASKEDVGRMVDIKVPGQGGLSQVEERLARVKAAAQNGRSEVAAQLKLPGQLSADDVERIKMALETGEIPEDLERLQS